MLTVIEGGRKESEEKAQRKREFLIASYRRQFFRKWRCSAKAGLCSAVFCGVKYVSLVSLSQLSYDETVSLFETIDDIQTLMSLMTPRQFITTFPIEKVYDGEKYGMKDYYSVRSELDKYPPDLPIKQNIDSVLMEYYNRDINMFKVQKWLTVDRLRRFQGERGLLEEFAEEHGVATYTFYKDENMMINNSTGETVEIQPAIPRGIHVIEGDQI